MLQNTVENRLSYSFFCVIRYELLYQTDVVYTIMQSQVFYSARMH